MGRRRYSPLVAGFVVGTRFAVKSLEPSLMPRSAVDQGLIMAGSFATGYVAGSASARVVGLIPVLGGATAVRMASALATGANSARFLQGANSGSTAPVDEASAWTEVGGEILASTAVAGLSWSDRPIAGTVGGLAVTVSTASDAETALALHDDAADMEYLATATGTAAAAVAAVAGVLASIRVAGRLARGATGSTGLRGTIISSAASLAMASALGAGARIALKRATESIRASNSAVEAAYASVPETTNVSGGRYSLVPFESLGLQGRRLVSVATPSGTIEAVMGEPARRDPVRVFIGIESAGTIEERVELAVQELRRAGGFDRSRILVASPAGTGYVNYITVEAAELMARGDIATVAVQYGSLPSMLSMNKIGQASAQYAALVRRLRSEIDALDREIDLIAYGESLGAQTGQNGILELSTGDSSPVDAALWVGTPHGSALFERMTQQHEVPVFDRPSQIEDHEDTVGVRPTTTFLNHDNDPVTRFSHSMFYAMPDWLRTNERGRGMNPHQRWLPGIAFWQGLIDTKNAATVVPGEFKSTGHDYRADLASFIRAAYGFDDVTSDQMADIEQRLRDSEIERASNIAQGTV